MKIPTLFSAALLLFAAIPVSTKAQQHIYVSDAGDEYVATPNANGAAFQSRYPKVRQVGSGAGRRMVRGLDKMYFGKNCDALHEVYGHGTWGWANGGFGADFENFAIRFPGQEVGWTDALDCQW